jgi:AcrR family transcriptional regulator
VSAQPTPGQSGSLTQLPRGHHGLPRDYVVRNQHARLAAAAIATGAARGYDQTTVSEVVAAGHLSRRTFYDHFHGKPECFVAAQGLIARHLRAAVGSAADPEDEWSVRVRARFDAALTFFAANPDLALFLLRVPSGTAQPDLRLAHRRFLDDAAAELVSDAPRRRERSPAFERAFLDGLGSRVIAAVESGEGARLLELGPELSQIYLAAFEPPGAISAADLSATAGSHDAH